MFAILFGVYSSDIFSVFAAKTESTNGDKASQLKNHKGQPIT